MRYFLLLCSGLLLLASVHARPPLSVRIGSIFLEGFTDADVSNTFRDSITSINERPDTKTRIDHDMQFTKLEQYDAYQKICMEMQLNVYSVFGSVPSTVDSNLGSVCSGLHIPYFSTSVSGGLVLKNDLEDKRFTVRMGPQERHIARAIRDIVIRMEWKRVAFLSHADTGHLPGRQLLESLQTSGIEVDFLDLPNKDIRSLFVNLREKGVQNFIVDVGATALRQFFQQALGSGIVHGNTNFVLTDLDFQSTDIGDLAFTDVNIVGLSLVNKARVESEVIAGGLSRSLGSRYMSSTRSSLLHDSVLVFKDALMKISNETDIEGPRVKCEDRDAPYEQGETLLDQIQKTYLSDCLTCRVPLSFVPSPLGGIERKRLSLDVVSKQRGSNLVVKVGEWGYEALTGDSQIQLEDIKMAKQQANIARRTIKVQAVQSKRSPYFQSSSSSSGNRNGEYEGFLLDLLNLICDDLGFSYSIDVSQSKGHQDKKTGNWTGIIGKVQRGLADVGLADLTQSSQRSKAVEFSTPFDVSSLTVVTKLRSSNNSSSSSSSSTLSLFSPFPSEMWFSIFAAIVLTSLFLFFVGRISPYERRATRDTTCFGDGMSICNSLWFVTAGIFGRTIAVAPRALSTRFLSIVWWLFCLVLVLLYVVNLLMIVTNGGQTSSSTADERTTLKQLIDDPDFSFGVVQKMATWDMLKHSSDATHQRIWSKVDKTLPIKRAYQGMAYLDDNPDFGFVSETKQIDPSRCDLVQVGELGTKYYGLIFPKGSDLREQFNERIVRYGEDGTLATLKEKWFKQEQCKSTKNQHGFEADGRYFNAPFHLLLWSGILSVFLALFELLVYSYVTSRRSQRRQRSNETFTSIFKEEVHNAVHCGGLRPLPPPSSPSIVAAAAAAAESPFKAAANGKHGPYYHQTQALLKRDLAAAEADENSQL